MNRESRHNLNGNQNDDALFGNPLKMNLERHLPSNIENHLRWWMSPYQARCHGEGNLALVYGRRMAAMLLDNKARVPERKREHLRKPTPTFNETSLHRSLDVLFYSYLKFLFEVFCILWLFSLQLYRIPNTEWFAIVHFSNLFVGLFAFLSCDDSFPGGFPLSWNQ